MDQIWSVKFNHLSGIEEENGEKIMHFTRGSFHNEDITKGKTVLATKVKYLGSKGFKESTTTSFVDLSKAYYFELKDVEDYEKVTRAGEYE